MNQLQKFAEEINANWIGGYSAAATEERLTVFLYGKEVASMSSKYVVVGEDAEAVEQLEYMANR